MYKKIILVFLLTIFFVYAHKGEELTGPEQHSPLEILLENPTNIIVAAMIFVGIAVVLYSLFPMIPKHRKIFILGSGSIALIFLILLFASITKQPDSIKQYHTHADFKLYLDGEQYNFSQKKYMSTNDSKLSEILHLHDMDGDIIHQHEKGRVLSEFFSTLNIKFNSTCFILDDGSEFCNSEDKTLKMYVKNPGENWQENKQFGQYEFQDLDQILISYGSETDLNKQMNSVTDKACIQSEKCPERGKPTDAMCAGNTCNVG